MKVGLALSGGGIRCVAHLGMMQALEEEGIEFDRVSGASAGAIAGALHCAGYSNHEILEIVSGTNFFKIIKPALNWRGILKIDQVANELAKHLPNDSFGSLKKPLIVSATNLTKGKIKYFKKGQLIKPILASCSIPVVFDPVIVNGTPYIDGGILDNLPIEPLQKKCDFVIGLHCNPIQPNYRVSNWKDLMERSLLMAISSGTYFNKKRCDIFWEPPALDKYKVFDYKKSREIFEIGYEYGKSQMKEFPRQKLLKSA
jgi:NTE family protein